MDHIPTDPNPSVTIHLADLPEVQHHIAALQARFNDLEERFLGLLDEHNRVIEILTEDQLCELNL